MISLAQIDYILALKEHQSFQKAASHCFVTQPTLSMQLKKAEEQLGNTIFDRDKTPIALTFFGETILPHLFAIKDGYEALSNQIKKLEGSYKAELRIGIIPTVAVYLVPDLYNSWQETLVDIKLEIVELKSEVLIEQLNDRKIDFGIMAGPLTLPKIVEQILFHEEITVFAPEVKSSLTFEKLETMQPWLLAQGNCLRTQMINFCSINEENKKTWNYEGGSIQLLLEMVNQQGGYTLVPKNYIPYTKIEADKFHHFKEKKPVRQIIGIYNERSSKIAYIEKIIRTIQRNKSSQELTVNQSNILPWK